MSGHRAGAGNLHIKLLWLAWLAIFALIPLFSVYGRSLQHWLSLQFSRQQLAVCIALVLIGLSAASAWVLIKRRVPGRVWHMLWLCALFILLPFYVPLIEERLHFILFGLFGFVTLLTYPRLVGFVIVLAISGMDELLQYALPDRVGDWLDVMFNLVAASGGALFALLIKDH